MSILLGKHDHWKIIIYSSPDKLKRSALTHAVMNGCTNVVSYLLYLGADADRVDSSNNSLIHYAAAYGWFHCLKLLVSDAGAKPDSFNDWQVWKTPLLLFLQILYQNLYRLRNTYAQLPTVRCKQICSVFGTPESVSPFWQLKIHFWYRILWT